MFLEAGRQTTTKDTKIKGAKISTNTGLDTSQWGTARSALGLTGYRVNYLKSGGEGFEYMTHDNWCTQIKSADFATQRWFDKPVGQ